MLEKLLENWLDSAGERSYQQAFVQMLSAQGYRVVHSTRHAAFEFGKDVLAIAPDGVGCAFQLKGNPGSRLGLSEFRREVQPQLVQLMAQAVVFPGFPAGRHRSYLVTNGYFDEEVQRAADDMNRTNLPSQLTLIARGELLGWAKQLGETLWPSELEDTQLLLQLFLANPRDLLPMEVLAKLVSKVVGMSGTGERVRRSQMDRAVPAAALLVGISTARFAEEENHLAVAWAWTLFVVTVLGSLDRHGLALKGPAAKSLALAEAAIGDALASLWQEVESRESLAEGGPLTDPEIYQWRRVILLGALSCLALKHESTPTLKESEYEALKRWLSSRGNRFQIWGESAIASVVPWLVWIQQHDSTIWSDIQIGGVTSLVITRNQRDSNVPLANPYHSFESIFRHLLPFAKPSKIREDFSGTSHTALLLFYLLVRTNLKQSCRLLWPDLTKLNHRTLVPDSRWEYCGLTVKSGIDETRVLPSEYGWGAVQRDAVKDCRESLPAEFAKLPWLLGLWWQIVPQRLTPDSSRVFANQILPRWGVSIDNA